MPAHFFCAQPHAPMSLLATAALVGFAHNLEPIMLHDGHVGHVTGWHVAQSLPSLARRSFPSAPPRHSRCTRPHVSCSAWAPGLTASPPFACRRSSSTSPRQPFRLLPLCGVICRLWPPVGGRGMMTIVWCHAMIRWWALIVAADFCRKGSAAPWAARSGCVMAQNLHPGG